MINTKHPNKPFAFTLVELIVVITILAILGTIAFISLQGFSTDARDGQRLNDVRVIEKGLSLHKTKGNSYPLPDNNVTITASGVIVSYQGSAGTGVLSSIGQAGTIVDPTLLESYTYTLSADKRYIQLLAYFEKNQLVSFNPSINSLGVSRSYAALTYDDLFPKSFGDSVGTLTSILMNEPIQNQTFPGDTVDFLDISSDEFRAYIGNDVYEGIRDVPAAIISNGNCKRILELGNSEGNGVYEINPTGMSPFDVYCDMKSEGGGWTLVSSQGPIPGPSIEYSGSGTVTLNNPGSYYSIAIINQLGYTDVAFTQKKIANPTDGYNYSYIISNNGVISAKTNSPHSYFQGDCELNHFVVGSGRLRYRLKYVTTGISCYSWHTYISSSSTNSAYVTVGQPAIDGDLLIGGDSRISDFEYYAYWVR